MVSAKLNERLSLRLDPDLGELVAADAARRDRSQAYVIRDILAEHYKAKAAAEAVVARAAAESQTGGAGR